MQLTGRSAPSPWMSGSTAAPRTPPYGAQIRRLHLSDGDPHLLPAISTPASKFRPKEAVCQALELLLREIELTFARSSSIFATRAAGRFSRRLARSLAPLA